MNPAWLQRPRKRGNPENHLRYQCLIYLKAKGFYCGKVKTTGARVEGRWMKDPLLLRGLPDIFAIDPQTKIFYAIECKIGKNPQSTFQKEFQRNFHFPTSRIYLIIRTLEELQEIIK